MKTYSDLQATKLQLDVELELVGSPDFVLTVKSGGQELTHPYEIDLLEPFTVTVELRNKQYTTEYETAVIVQILVDGIEIVPRFAYLADYVNDHNHTGATNYIGFNGTWTLDIDRPFYHWLHQHTGQGWLID